jgi:hypothetical protein
MALLRKAFSLYFGPFLPNLASKFEKGLIRHTRKYLKTDEKLQKVNLKKLLKKCLKGTVLRDRF